MLLYLLSQIILVTAWVLSNHFCCSIAVSRHEPKTSKTWHGFHWRSFLCQEKLCGSGRSGPQKSAGLVWFSQSGNEQTSQPPIALVGTADTSVASVGLWEKGLIGEAEMLDRVCKQEMRD